jgi:hypothetical protein
VKRSIPGRIKRSCNSLSRVGIGRRGAVMWT